MHALAAPFTDADLLAIASAMTGQYAGAVPAARVVEIVLESGRTFRRSARAGSLSLDLVEQAARRTLCAEIAHAGLTIGDDTDR